MHDDLQNPWIPSHTAIRVIVVFALALLMCVWHLPDLVRVLGQPMGDWGFRTDGATVVGTDRAGPADRAGLRAGDAIDLAANDPRDVEMAVSGFAVRPNDHLIVKIKSGAQVRTVTLRAVAEPASYLPMIVVREVLFVVPLIAGIMLVLLRPSLTTWGLYLYTVGFANAPTAIAEYRLMSAAGERVFDDVAMFVTDVVGNAGLLLFVFTLATPKLGGWRKGAVLAAALAGMLAFTPTLLYGNYSVPAVWVNVTVAAGLAVSLLAVLGLVDAYVHVPLRFKQRLKWIGAGLLLGTFASVADALLWPNYESYATHTAFAVLLSLFPLIAAYAILRERVVDVNFAISRTLVLGMLTASIVAAFALIDYVFSKVLEQARFSVPVDILAALGLGFSFHTLQRKIDLGVDRVLFRKRYKAEKRLAKAANAVLHVNARETVADFLVRLPVEVLDLTGAALYRSTGTHYELIARAGWPDPVPVALNLDDPLVVYASAELVPLRISDVPLRDQGPGRSDVPVLAIPLVMRRELVGVVLYGAHRNGADIDSDEERALSPLVTNAVVTYDHLDALALREEVDRLRSLRPSLASG